MFNPALLPDVASHKVAELPHTLQWVGMEDIAVPLMVPMTGGREIGQSHPAASGVEKTLQQVSAKASLYVNLDKRETKGIHMSRLHLALNQKLAWQGLTAERMSALLEYMVNSQEGISHQSRLVLEFDLMLQKPALLSGELGFQSYPVRLDMQYSEGAMMVEVDLTIPYSSTCPCSASLSRQLYAEALNERFPEDSIDKQTLIDFVVSDAGSVATPHSQRSYAYLKLSMVRDHFPDLAALIMQFEGVIGTPVQTAVKRQDEQAFARLNAENLMFCEDAARRFKHALEKMDQVKDYWFKVEHQESLHAHNAVVVDQKF